MDCKTISAWSVIGEVTYQKLRPVVGNLDPHKWSSEEVFAPFMTSKQHLKSSNVKQAFVKETLPEEEQYTFRPPPGCPKSLPDTYWLLK
eukprot:10379457-Ditylum_brightwellii.AAC.1